MSQELIDKIKEITAGDKKASAKEKINTSQIITERAKKSFSKFLSEIKDLVADQNRPAIRLQRVKGLADFAKLSIVISAEDSIKAYNDLVNNASAAAVDASNAIDELTVTLPAVLVGENGKYVSNDPTKVAELILEVKEGIEAQSTKGSTLLEGFNKLAGNIKDFQARAKTELGETNVGKVKEHKELVDELEKKNKEIADITVNIMEPLVKFLGLGTGAFKDTAGGTPVEAFSSIMNAVAKGVEELVEYNDELNKADQKRQLLEGEVKEIKIKIELLENSQAKIEDAKIIPECLRSVWTDLQDLGKRVSDFLNVQKELHEDFNTLASLLLAIPDDTTLDDTSHPAVQLYLKKYEMAVSLQDINQRVISAYVHPTWQKASAKFAAQKPKAFATSFVLL